MEKTKILIPYNFTEYDQKAVDFVIRTFTPPLDHEITLFSLYTPLPEIDMGASPVMAKLKTNMNYLAQRMMEQKESLNKVRQVFVNQGYADENVHYVFKAREKDIGREIIDFAANEGFRIIVLNQKPGKVTRYFTGNAYKKIVGALKDMVVCIVS